MPGLPEEPKSPVVAGARRVGAGRALAEAASLLGSGLLFLSGCRRIVERMFDKEVEAEVVPAGSPAEGGSVGRLDDRVAAHNQSLLALLDEVAGIDTDELWLRWGAPTVTELLTSRYGVSVKTARDWQRVASALDDLPVVRGIFISGRLSWEQLREVTRIATADSDGEWAQRAQEMTPADRRVRLPPTKESVVEALWQRSLRWWFASDTPEFHLEMTCPDTEGAVIATALMRLANQAEPDPVSGVYESFDARCADALWQMASQALAADSDVDRATVVVTTSLDAIRSRAGGSFVDGPAVLPETLERLLCDGRLQLAVEGDNHGVVGVGRTMRIPPPALRRIVVARDGGCRFPRCRRSRWVHVHHLVHWAHGGPTDLDNLITLCGLHHRLIHEGGWSVSGDPTDHVTWITRHGFVHDPGLPSPDYEHKRQGLEHVPDIKPPHRPHAGRSRCSCRARRRPDSTCIRPNRLVAHGESVQSPAIRARPSVRKPARLSHHIGHGTAGRSWGG